MDDRMLVRRQLRACGPQHAVRGFGVRCGRYRPCRQRPVEAVGHRREACLAGGDAEPGDIGGPKAVRQGRMEIPPNQVGGRIRYLALAGTAMLGLLIVDDDAVLLGHDPVHDLLRDDDGLLEAPRPMRDVAVPARSVCFFGDLHDLPPQVAVLVLAGDRRPPVPIGALRDPQGSGGPFQGVSGLQPR